MRRRVSSPVAGATSRATAAPVRAPSTKAVMIVAAPPSSLAICNLAGAPTSENAHPDVEELARVLPDVGDERPQVVRRAIDIVIQLLVVEELPCGSLTFLDRPDQTVDSLRNGVEPLVELLIGQQLPRRPLTRLQLAADLFEVGGRRGERLRERVVVQQPSETAFAGANAPGHIVEIAQGRRELAVRGFVTGEASKRALSAVDIGSNGFGGRQQRIELTVDPV